MRSEPGRPEFKARRFHTPVENAIYLLGTSATRAQPASLSAAWVLLVEMKVPDPASEPTRT
jgi:hypothetical protein